MPHRRVRVLPAKPPRRPPLEFRKQFDKLEARRAELFARLQLLSKRMRRHPGYKHALTLLNYTFRRQKLAGRLLVLRDAAWLINLLEQLSTLT